MLVSSKRMEITSLGPRLSSSFLSLDESLGPRLGNYLLLNNLEEGIPMQVISLCTPRSLAPKS